MPTTMGIYLMTSYTPPVLDEDDDRIRLGGVGRVGLGLRVRLGAVAVAIAVAVAAVAAAQIAAGVAIGVAVEVAVESGNVGVDAEVDLRVDIRVNHSGSSPV